MPSPLSQTTQREAVATHESEAYPTIPVQDYQDGPIEELADHYVRINRVVAEKAK